MHLFSYFTYLLFYLLFLQYFHLLHQVFTFCFILGSLDFLTKDAPSLFSVQACPEHPFRCHGLIIGGQCIGTCEAEREGMTIGEALIMSATHALQYDCRKYCSGENIGSKQCQTCIYEGSGIEADEATKQRFPGFFSNIASAININTVSCTVRIAPKIAECVALTRQNIKELIPCAMQFRGGDYGDCVCTVLCSVYKPACNACKSVMNG